MSGKQFNCYYLYYTFLQVCEVSFLALYIIYQYMGIKKSHKTLLRKQINTIFIGLGEYVRKKKLYINIVS